MQINLPDHAEIAFKAMAAGFATVEDYVRHLIEEDDGPLEQPEANGGPLSAADWQRRFQDLLASVEPGNPSFDDSRASMYPVR